MKRRDSILLDISPETAARRKSAGRDRYERDLELLARVRDSYRRQSHQDGWLLLDGERNKSEIAAEVNVAASPLLERR